MPFGYPELTRPSETSGIDDIHIIRFVKVTLRRIRTEPLEIRLLIILLLRSPLFSLPHRRRLSGVDIHPCQALSRTGDILVLRFRNARAAGRGEAFILLFAAAYAFPRVMQVVLLQLRCKTG